MEGGPDLSKIKPESPAPGPDPQATREAKEAGTRRGPTVGQQAEAARAAHIIALQQTITIHAGRCDELKEQNAALHAELATSRKAEAEARLEAEALRRDVAHSKGISGYSTTMVIAGAGMLAVAGAAPELSVALRYLLVGSGVLATVAGLWSGLLVTREAGKSAAHRARERP